MPLIPGPLRRWLVPRAQRFELAPRGWENAGAEQGGEDFWAHFIEQERAACEALIAHARAGGDVLALDADERAKRAAFGEVLAIAAPEHQPITILDVGGNLGDYYWIGKALVPGVEIEFHCQELPAIAAAGRAVNPAVTFHAGDDAFDRSYDLVMFSSSLQCLPRWRAVLDLAARAARKHLFLSDVPTVRTVPSFVVASHLDGKVSLQHQLNRSEVLTVVQSAGFQVVREFDMGPHPPVANAPEPSMCTGWLFAR
jgi:putative methyltransferase (TIGR04325 family)